MQFFFHMGNFGNQACGTTTVIIIVLHPLSHNGVGIKRARSWHYLQISNWQLIHKKIQSLIECIADQRTGQTWFPVSSNSWFACCQPSSWWLWKCHRYWRKNSANVNTRITGSESSDLSTSSVWISVSIHRVPPCFQVQTYALVIAFLGVSGSGCIECQCLCQHDLHIDVFIMNFQVFQEYNDVEISVFLVNCKGKYTGHCIKLAGIFYSSISRCAGVMRPVLCWCYSGFCPHLLCFRCT